jgi:4'-phosphopantetheinyl transferase
VAVCALTVGPGRALPGPDPAPVCDVWWAGIHAARSDLAELLDPVERARFARYRPPADGVLYLVTHALARLVLGARLNLPPADVEFDRTCRRCGGAHGKPTVAGHPIQFSLAHSGELAVLAVGGVDPVGVDVEELGQRVEVETLSRAALVYEERRELAQLPPERRHRALLTYWTRKEAVLKAVGDGLSTRPTRVSVTPPTARPRVLDGPATWGGVRAIHLVDLNPAGPYVGALASLAGRPPRVVERDGAALLAAVRRPGAPRTPRPG